MSSAEPNIRTVEARWQEYRLLVVPANASQMQVTCMRQAFYAGAASMFHAIVRDAADLPDGDFSAALSRLSRELREHAANPT